MNEVSFRDTGGASPVGSKARPTGWVRSHARLIVAGLVVLAVIAGVWFWLSRPAPQKPEPPSPVVVAQAVRKNMTLTERTIGTVLANTTVNVSARVQGEIVKVGFKEGDIVKQGQMLFQLDPRPFQAALEQAIAAQKRDQATLVSDQKQAERYQALSKEGAIAAQTMDTAVAEAQAMAATVVSDKAAADAARLNLTYSTIRAPVTGKTGPILIQIGNLVSADSTNPLVTIAQIRPVKVSLFLPQQDIPRIQQQMSKGQLYIDIPMPGAQGGKETAKADFIGNDVSNQTGTIELRATFNNADFRLVPGQTADAGVTLENLPDSIVVPRNAVNVGPNGSYVFVVTPKMTAAMRNVTVLYDGGMQEAIKGDVKPGDRVVTEGQLRLLDGSKVKITGKGAGTANTTQYAPGAQ